MGTPRLQNTHIISVERNLSAFNTTIDTDILQAFKTLCKIKSYPMNVVLELFMKQFINGEFDIYLKRQTGEEVIK